tara:strand:+ start:406 stop:1740 length:1335 start_codon:yes stop_codon:yes gene_type:complete
MNKEMPHSYKSEVGLLTNILMDTEKLYKVNLSPSEFYNVKHQTLFAEIQKHANQLPNWDTITLYEHLDKNGKLEDVGGLTYFMELQDPNKVSINTNHYAKIIREQAELRSEIRTYKEALEKGFQGVSVSDGVISKLMGKPIEVVHDIDKIVHSWKEAQKGNRTCIPTPYESIDRQTGGIKQGMVTIFTGRSKSGKSMFLSHWYNYLGKKNIPIMVVPLEDKYDVTIKRMAGNLGAINVSELDAGGRYLQNRANFNAWEYYHTLDKEIDDASTLLKTVSKYPVYFYDRKVTPAQLRGVAIRYKKQYNIQAMFIDGAKDLLRPSGKYADVGFDEEISQQLCAIAEELNIAVISVHHLTKISEFDRINVNHIRGSGNIVGDARAVYALQSMGIENLLADKGYTPKYDQNGNLTTRIFECLVNNHGGIGMKALDSDLNKCQFYESQKQ